MQVFIIFFYISMLLIRQNNEFTSAVYYTIYVLILKAIFKDSNLHKNKFYREKGIWHMAYKFIVKKAYGIWHISKHFQ